MHIDIFATFHNIYRQTLTKQQNDELRHVITNNNVIMPAAYTRNENKPHLIIRPIPEMYL